MLPYVIRSLQRARAMGASVIILTTESIEEEIRDFTDIIAFNDSVPIFNNLAVVAGMFRASSLAKEINDKSAQKSAI